jgi:hypothetical protein
VRCDSARSSICMINSSTGMLLVDLYLTKVQHMSAAAAAAHACMHGQDKRPALPRMHYSYGPLNISPEFIYLFLSSTLLPLVLHRTLGALKIIHEGATGFE